MNNDIKFTGTFTELKGMGYDFMKLYANNYKVYNNDDFANKIWVWVADGGYIELDDLYDCSKLYIEAIKSINWDTIKEGFSGKKHVYFHYKHGEPDKGFEISKQDFGNNAWMMYWKECDKLGIETSPLNEDIYKKCYEAVREKYD